MDATVFAAKPITVLIPVYNAASYAERCLTSLFENSYADKATFIICDDCSKDNSVQKIADICARYPQLSISIIKNAENKGTAKTRNRLLEMVKTEYFIFVDADDYTEQDFLEKLYTAAIAEHADIVRCNYYVVQQGKVERKIQSIVHENHALCLALLTGESASYLWTNLMRTDFVRQHSIVFTEAFNLMEDFSFLFKCYYHAPNIVYLADALYYYNRENLESMVGILTEKNIADLKAALQDVKSYAKSRQDFDTFENAWISRYLKTYKVIMFDSTFSQKWRHRNWAKDYRAYLQESNIDNHFHNRCIIWCYANHLFFLGFIIQLLYAGMRAIRSKIRS